MHKAILRWGAAVAAVAAITALIYFLPATAHLANISLLYLLAVIATALRFGRGPAIVASVLAFLAFDWFFVDPRYTFTVSDPAEWLTLFVFLLTATVTGQLTALLRARADEARRRERQTAALAEASWAIASRVERNHALTEVLRRLNNVMEPQAAAIFTRGTGTSCSRWPSRTITAKVRLIPASAGRSGPSATSWNTAPPSAGKATVAIG